MNTIISMNHSGWDIEPQGEPLQRDRDLVALHAELVALAGESESVKFGRSLPGLDYSAKCIAYRNEIAERTPVRYVAALVAALDEPRNPKYPASTFYFERMAAVADAEARDWAEQARDERPM